MHSRLLGGTVAAAVVAGLMLAATAPTAHAADPVEIHQGDFIGLLGDTRSAGHYDFTAEGIHLWTDNATSQAKVAEYFALTGSLTDMVGSTPPAWTGTSPAPGSQIVFDADGTTGNGNDGNILVGESVYGGSDWWLSNNSSPDAKSAAPLTTGGSGSGWHGTLADWAAALPDARVYAGGFSLGSGVLGDGVLTGLRFGSTDYTFAGLAQCDVDVDHAASTFTLLDDCTTSRTVRVDDDWTVDGDGHAIIGLETPSTSFKGAVVQNAGTSMHLWDLTVRGSDDWENPGKNSGGDLAGVRFKNASGSVGALTITGISHGNGVQEGNGLDIDNVNGATERTITVDDVTVTRYQKTGVRINGNVKVTLTDSVIGAAGAPSSGDPLDTVTAANSLQVSRGADAVVRRTSITGNDWDTNDSWNATAVLFYQAGNVTFEHNVIGGAGVDFGVVSDSATGSVTVRCNLVSRTADNAGGMDVWSTGIGSYGDAGFTAVDNTIEGYETPSDGVTNVVNQGACAPNAPTVAVSDIDASSAEVSWTAGTTKPYAPVSGWELSGPGGIVTVPVGTTSYHLSGLKAGRDYSVSVRALNVSGGSTWANATFETPGPTPPAAKSSTLTVSPTTVVYKSSATASGVLKADATGVHGQTVTVWRFAAGAWAKVGTATTAANGAWSLTFAPVVSSSLQATAPGFPTATAKVTVALKVKAKAKPHAVKVKVSPKVPGGKVVLQKWTKGTWKKAGKAVLSASSKAKFKDLAKGKYRVVAKKAPGFAKGASATVKVKP